MIYICYFFIIIRFIFIKMIQINYNSTKKIKIYQVKQRKCLTVFTFSRNSRDQNKKINPQNTSKYIVNLKCGYRVRPLKKRVESPYFKQSISI